MARVRQSAELRSREARRRLPTRKEPYWHAVERGLYLGYRKFKDGGTWVSKRYVGGKRYAEARVATADDNRDADGADVMDFGQAQRRLLDDARQGALQASGQLYTVADAVADYLEYMRAHRKGAEETESKFKAYVLPELGAKRVADLTPEDFTVWLSWALKRRRRTRKAKYGSVKAVSPKPPEARSADVLAERQRRRKATINRVINAMKACLNHAYAAGKAPSKEAWARLKKFRSADASRLRWLSVGEAKRLQNAAGPDLRPLIRAGLLTGCRAGELRALRAGDYEPQSNTVLIADSKGRKPRRVPLTEDGAKLFARLVAGLEPDSRLFLRSDGSTWYRMALVRAMRTACAAAKIHPPATFHTLRHTYASHLVQAGVPLLFVASALGHSDMRMVEKHYGHLSASHVADMIRKNLPSFGGEPAGKVRSIHSRA
jgi:integrase